METYVSLGTENQLVSVNTALKSLNNMIDTYEEKKTEQGYGMLECEGTAARVAVDVEKKPAVSFQVYGTSGGFRLWLGTISKEGKYVFSLKETNQTTSGTYFKEEYSEAVSGTSDDEPFSWNETVESMDYSDPAVVDSDFVSSQRTGHITRTIYHEITEKYIGENNKWIWSGVDHHYLQDDWKVDRDFTKAVIHVKMPYLSA